MRQLRLSGGAHLGTCLGLFTLLGLETLRLQLRGGGQVDPSSGESIRREVCVGRPGNTDAARWSLSSGDRIH